MRTIFYLAFLILVTSTATGCTEGEKIIQVCIRGKIIDYNCGRNPVVHILTPDLKIGVKVRVGNSTQEIENVVQLNNLPASFNQIGTELYFSFRTAKDHEKENSPCLAIYIPYNVPQLMVNGVWDQACPEDFDDD